MSNWAPRVLWVCILLLMVGVCGAEGKVFWSDNFEGDTVGGPPVLGNLQSGSGQTGSLYLAPLSAVTVVAGSSTGGTGANANVLNVNLVNGFNDWRFWAVPGGLAADVTAGQYIECSMKFRMNSWSDGYRIAFWILGDNATDSGLRPALVYCPYDTNPDGSVSQYWMRTNGAPVFGTPDQYLKVGHWYNLVIQIDLVNQKYNVIARDLDGVDIGSSMGTALSCPIDSVTGLCITTNSNIYTIDMSIDDLQLATSVPNVPPANVCWLDGFENDQVGALPGALSLFLQPGQTPYFNIMPLTPPGVAVASSDSTGGTGANQRVLKFTVDGGDLGWGWAYVSATPGIKAADLQAGQHILASLKFRMDRDIPGDKFAMQLYGDNEVATTQFCTLVYGLGSWVGDSSSPYWIAGPWALFNGDPVNKVPIIGHWYQLTQEVDLAAQQYRTIVQDLDNVTAISVGPWVNLNSRVTSITGWMLGNGNPACSQYLSFDDLQIGTTPPLPTIPAAASVTVDGDLADWNGVTWIAVDQVQDGTPDDIDAEVPEAYWATQWTAAGLYMAVKVRDTSHFFTDNYTGWNERDAIELYLHTTGTAPGNDYSANQAAAQQLIVGIKGSNHSAVWASLGGQAVPASYGYQAAGKEVGEWLYYEVFMPSYQNYGGVDHSTTVAAPLAANELVGADVLVVGYSGLLNSYMGTKAVNGSTGKYYNYAQFGQYVTAAAPVRYVINGTASLNDFAGNKTAVPVAVELRTDTTINQTVNLDNAGHFTIANVPAGTYNVWIKPSHWLAKRINGLTISDNTTNLGTISFINGDADGNNSVSPPDLSIILASMDTGSGGSADLDGDGEITSTDMSIVLANMDSAGSP